MSDVADDRRVAVESRSSAELSVRLVRCSSDVTERRDLLVVRTSNFATLADRRQSSFAFRGDRRRRRIGRQNDVEGPEDVPAARRKKMMKPCEALSVPGVSKTL